MIGGFMVEMRTLLFPLVLLFSFSASAKEGFEFVNTPGKHVDVKFNGRNVARYQYEPINETSKETRDLTYKPFHLVYDAEGKEFITKGAGGKFPHHRGIFYGFSKTRYPGANGKQQVVDTWHCREGYQKHKAFVAQDATEKAASHTVLIDWHGNDGKVFAQEVRTLHFMFDPQGALVVNFNSELKPAEGVEKITLDGDPQHAGFQFRAAQEVAAKTAKQTYYIRPKTGKAKPGETINWDKKNDNDATRDLPWKAMSYVVQDQRWTCVYLDHPKNPKPARFSERDYGRFGSYFVATATKEKPVRVKYRLVIKQGEFTKAECEKLSNAFTKGA